MTGRARVVIGAGTWEDWAVDISRPPAVRGAGNTTAGGLASREGAD